MIKRANNKTFREIKSNNLFLEPKTKSLNDYKDKKHIQQ